MADGPDLSELMRRTVQANARFYKGWMDLSLEYLRGLGEIFGGADLVPGAAPTASGAAEEPEAGPGVILVEAEQGTTVRCAFLVTNDLGRKLSCDLFASDFTGPDGTPVTLAATFDPPRVELEPGEQRVVRALVPLDDRLPPGVAHTGTFAIRGLDGFSVPVIVRRRHGIAEGGAATPQQPTATTAPSRTKAPRSRRTAGRSRTSGTTAAPEPGRKPA